MEAIDPSREVDLTLDAYATASVIADSPNDAAALANGTDDGLAVGDPVYVSDLGHDALLYGRLRPSFGTVSKITPEEFESAFSDNQARFARPRFRPPSPIVADPIDAPEVA